MSIIKILGTENIASLVSLLKTRSQTFKNPVELNSNLLKLQYELEQRGISFVCRNEFELTSAPVESETALSLVVYDMHRRPDAGIRNYLTSENVVVVSAAQDYPILLQKSLSINQKQYLRGKLFKNLAQMDLLYAEELQQKISTTELRKVLIVGSGGREHAIASKVAQRAGMEKVFIAPGNGGTCTESGICENVNIAADDVLSLVEFAIKQKVQLVIVGPEQPLVNGLVDALHAPGVNIPCFGPSQQASVLESSKAWSKDFMQRYNIPTAKYGRFTEFDRAKLFIEQVMTSIDGPVRRVVVKASGLAAGKGVLLPNSMNEAIKNAHQILVEGIFGDAGKEIVVEEFLVGDEVSILAFADGITVSAMPAAQDHKRVFDNDEGPNTGGMGAYAPAPVISPLVYQKCVDILQQTVQAMALEGRHYCGVLYGGFILTPDRGPMVLEYNCRFGDPETQVLLPLLESDICDIALACIEGRLAALQGSGGVRFKQNTSACTVVVAAPGYPDHYPKGDIIDGLLTTHAATTKDKHFTTKIFHAGTKVNPANRDEIVTNGGRVLAITGTAPTLNQAVQMAYARIQQVQFPGMHYRRDIAQRGLRQPPLRIAVLGSTRGTSLQPVIDAIQQEAGSLYGRATIEVVVSNVAETGENILGRARHHHIPGVHLPTSSMEEDAATNTLVERKKTRKEFDAELVEILQRAEIDLVLCVGYMRILSSVFLQAFAMRCLNVHPSLLPEFAGGMDLDVHRAVLAAGKVESGCTVHFVTEEVDGGPIAVQIRVPIAADGSETPESLKGKVQVEEGKAFIEAIQKFIAGDIGPNKSEVGSQVQLSKETITYRQAGVDIDAGEALVDLIKPFCRSTKRSGCDIFSANEEMLGGFGGLFDLSKAGYPAEDTILVSGTDGVGTKLKIAQSIGKHDTIGIDLVAMCVNDILVCGAEPLFFLDYYATGALQVQEAAAVVSGIAEGCRQAGCALIGGETAEMAGMYHRGEYDLAGFAVGAVRRPHILPRTRELASGDVLLGLSSSGVHSNGYSLVRKCVEKSGLAWSDPVPFDDASGGRDLQRTLGEALLTPTRIYVKALLPLVRRGLVKAMAHITGGGLLDNLPRVLPESLCALVDIPASGWTLPPVFAWLQDIANLSQAELLRTFNNGIGMILVVRNELVDEVTALLMDECGESPVYRLVTEQGNAREKQQLSHVQRPIPIVLTVTNRSTSCIYYLQW